MSTDPLVSVIVPARNRGDLLAEALNGVAEQTFSGFETVVVDDGSSDGTSPGRMPSVPGLRWIRQRALGVSCARNRGVREAKGEWLAFLDSDDRWLPDSLATRIEYVRTNPDAGFVYSDADLIDAAGNALGRRVSERREPRTGRVVDALFRDNFVCTSSVLVRKDLVARAGGFRTRYEPAEDLDLWFRIAERTEFDYVPRSTLQYRVHDGAAGADLERMFEALARVLEDFASRKTAAGPMPPGWARRLSDIHYFLGGRLRGSDPRRARSHLLRSLRHRPVGGRTWLRLAACLLPIPGTAPRSRTHADFH